MSLRIRLTIWVIGLFVVLQLVTTTVVLLYQRSTIERMFDAQLNMRAGAMVERVSKALPDLTNEGLAQIAFDVSTRLAAAPSRVLVVGQDGSDWTKTGLEWPPEVFGLAKKCVEQSTASFATVAVDWFKSEVGGSPTSRVVARPIRGSMGRPYALVIATSDESIRAQHALILRTFALAGVIALTATAISGWHIAGLATKPLRQFKAIASGLGPASISEEIRPQDSSAEVLALTKALNEARVRIRDAFNAQDRFLSNVSHEIKTPIATILVEAQTIDQSALSPPAAQFVKTAEEEMRRVGRLVESFLTLTRVRDGRGLQSRTVVAMNDVVIESVGACAAMAKQQGLILSPSLIESEEFETTLPGDADLLRTMTENLIRNGIRFSPQGQAVRIQVSATAEAIEVAVRDQGPAVPSDMISHMFDRFVDQPAHRRHARGQGLGLAISQAVAELHGGKISVVNCDGGGVEFRASLPRRDARSTTSGDAQSLPKSV